MKHVLKKVSKKGETWPQILQYDYEKYGDSRVAMRHKRNGIWQPYTWKDYYLNVRHLALGLLSLGFQHEDKVAIIGDNAPEWYCAELATQAIHGVSVGMYSDLTPAEIKHIAENSEARFAVVQDQEQVDKLLEVKEALPLLRAIIYWDYKGLVRYDNPILIGYKQLLQLGEQHDRAASGAFEDHVRTGRSDDVCAIVYTSGTTGAPKGAVHTHRTMKASAEACLRLDPWYDTDNIVPSLPPAWITEQWMAIGCHLLSGSILNFFEKPETQQQDTREIGPNVVFYGARLWESQASEVQARILEADVIKRFAFRTLMPVSYKIAELKYRKQKPGIVLRMLHGLANIVLIRRIRDSLGLSKARICYNTSALLSPDAFKFYHALNLPLKSLYGTTEGGVLTGANSDAHFETVVSAGQEDEVRVTDSGEIVYRQPAVFIGYYKDPDKTAEVLNDGWFSSGDGGSIEEDGYIIFEDRVNDLVRIANGDKIAPQLIESRLRFSPYIKDAWVVAGRGRPYSSAVIVIDYTSVGRWAGQKRLSYRTFAELSQKIEVCELIKRYIEKINQDLPIGAKVKKYVNLHREFDPVEGELTRTRKLRRAFLEQRYAGLIDAIYGDKTEVPIHGEAKNNGGRKDATATTVAIKLVEGAG